MLDGLRTDRVNSSPSLQSIKQKSIYFSNIITAAPYTLASLHSIFSGMHPSRNGVCGYYRLMRFKKDEITTLPELLKEQDYYTACDVIHDAIIPGQGFDEKGIFDEESVNFKKRHSELIERLAKKNKKFFLFLHYTEPHKHLVDALNKTRTNVEYDESSEKNRYSDEDKFFSSIEENKKRYDSYMPELDNYVNSILNSIKTSGISDNTVIIFHSDHGTSLGEKKGEKFYGEFLYDYTIKLFSSIYIPNHTSQIIDTQCRSIDLYPTIADIANIQTEKLDPLVQGKSLFPIIDKHEQDDREAFVETGGLFGPWPSPEIHNVFCIRNNGKKLIYNATPETWEFYDLIKDPEEYHNLYDDHSNEISKFKERLIHHLNENGIDTNISN